jgi:hypothetical protein
MLRKDVRYATEPDTLKVKSVRPAEDRGTCSLPSLQEYVHSATGPDTMKQELAGPVEVADGLYFKEKEKITSEKPLSEVKSKINALQQRASQKAPQDLPATLDFPFALPG